MGGKKEIYQYIRFFHGALQLMRADVFRSRGSVTDSHAGLRHKHRDEKVRLVFDITWPTHYCY